jgi:DNA ligase-1
MTTIYKKDTTGKIRYIKTWTDGAILYQESGVLGTDKPVTHEKTCKAKNVGRSNETTPENQALSEMESLIAEKLKGEYFQTLAEAEGGAVILPMLAKSYKDESKKVDWKNAYVQPKLDGMRALGDQSLISREGTIIDTVPHLIDIVKAIPLHLDGELYAHGKTFQENMRLIKKHRPGESEAVKYHVYDVVSDKPFSERYKYLKHIIETERLAGTLEIELVPTIQVHNEKELKVAHAKFLGEGYEGTILRWGDAPYKVAGRSSNLLKYKDFLDLALEIKDIEPANQRPEWAVPVFDYNGKEFRAGMKFSHAEREEILRNKQNYIGKVAELRFFEWTEDEIPRFPVMVGIREDRTKGDK